MPCGPRTLVELLDVEAVDVRRSAVDAEGGVTAGAVEVLVVDAKLSIVGANQDRTARGCGVLDECGLWADVVDEGGAAPCTCDAAVGAGVTVLPTDGDDEDDDSMLGVELDPE
ncbi:hypothetical protein HDU93_005292, partial [Gonapodya sp. JEL0774]